MHASAWTVAMNERHMAGRMDGCSPSETMSFSRPFQPPTVAFVGVAEPGGTRKVPGSTTLRVNHVMLHGLEEIFFAGEPQCRTKSGRACVCLAFHHDASGSLRYIATVRGVGGGSIHWNDRGLYKILRAAPLQRSR